MPDPSVFVEDLAVRHGDVVAVDGVSFTVDRGEVVVLLGPNGAGKTSTVETIEGFRRPSAGTVRVLGHDPVADHGWVAERLGVMLQGGGVYPGIRVGEAVQLFAHYYAGSVPVGPLLERVGLAGKERRTWRQLSGGEQQRLSLALALVGRPEVVVLDEPSAGVDAAGRVDLRAAVRGLADDGVAVLLTTHDLAEAERVADRLLVVDRGRLVAAGTVAELTSGEAGDGVRFEAAPGLDVADLGRALGGVVVEEAAGEYRADVEPSPANVAALTAWLAQRHVAVGHLRAGRQRLEDVFLRLTAGEADDTGAAAEQRRGQ